MIARKQAKTIASINAVHAPSGHLGPGCRLCILVADFLSTRRPQRFTLRAMSAD
jgi:hypothetical protein